MLSILFLLLFGLQSSFATDFSHAVSLFYSPKYPPNFTNFAYVDVEAKKGGTMKFANDGGFNSLNNFLLKGMPADGLSHIYDTLAEASEDELGVFYGLVAESIKLQPNYIEFKLNKSAYFHDKQPITADDIVFTFATLQKYGHPLYQLNLKQIAEVIKINQHQVRFVFASQHSRDLPIFIASLPVLPKHYYSQHDFQQTSMIPPLGSGPYKIKEVKQNYRIIYERVADYWAKDLPINRGRHNFDALQFDYYRDSTVLLEAFKAQAYDFRQESVARNWANAYNIAAIDKGEIIKTEIEHNFPAPMQAFVFNLRRQKFNDLALRKAINYAFDFLWLKQHIFYGSYEKTKSFFANSAFGKPDNNISDGSIDGFNRQNLLLAQKILLDAGYTIKENQLFDKQNNKVELEFLIQSRGFEMIVAAFSKNLERLGIKVKMRLLEENQYQNRLNNFDFDIVVAVFPQSMVPGAELYSYFHSSQRDIKGSKNLLGLNDKKVDSLVEQVAKSKNQKQIQKLCQQLDEYLLANYFVVPQWYGKKYRILYRNIFVIPKIRPKYGLAIDSWYSK